ncbi:ABC transporter permease [Haloimpatiens massiliensis]|uniref:ABC transporter permease n=1 Tax=Haloimpatiens massiliensis TaxID=1658110 RepID=UPI000C81A9EC|nr:iron ABC transporter permease [Haloimpatiens massiliensis]
MRLGKKESYINIWSVLSTIFALMIIVTNVDIIMKLFSKGNENWIHIKTYLLKDYFINTLNIMVFTGILTMVIGTLLAWLISAYEFPLRKFFKWSLILPLTIPPYIGAYTYNGILSYTGVVQRFLREIFRINVSPGTLDIMSIRGSIFIFTVFLFPYVYMITRAFLEKQSAEIIESGRVLGKNSLEIFIKIIIPISRGAIIGGVSLVLMEVLNDYGVVSYFGVSTISKAIFTSWFSMGDLHSATKLSSILMFMVFILIILERQLRGRKKYSFVNSKIRPIRRKKLEGAWAFIAFILCSVVLAISFIIPVLQLISWSILTYKKVLSVKFLILIFNSTWTAVITSLIIVFMTIIIGNFSRIKDDNLSKLVSKITLLGYSIPASVISIGVILFFVKLDKLFYPLYKVINSNSPKLVLSTSIIMLIFAYVIRFLAIGYQSIEAGFEKIGKRFFEASRSLGYSDIKTFFKVDLPMIKPAVISAFALVFLEIIKELTLTLILRPFNFNTLATKTFEYANDEMIQEASVASIIIIFVSIYSIYLMYKRDREENNVCRNK